MKIYHKLLITTALAGGAHLAEAQNTQVFTSEERYFHEGLELFDRAKYGSAQQAFAKYISLINDEAKTADAQYYYALSGLYLLHPDAEQLVINFVNRFPSHPKATTAFYELGLFYFDKKSYEKAAEYLQKVPSSNLSADQQKEAEFKLAYSYFANKEFDKAKTLFDRNKGGRHKYSYASSYYAGYIAYRNGDYAAAKADLRTAEENEAYKQVIPSMLTEILYKEGNYDEVIGYGETTLARKPKPQNTDEIQLLVGDAYFKKNDYANAAKYFNEYAAGKRRLDDVVNYKVGFANFKTGNYHEAIKHLKEVAIAKDSTGQNAAYHLGLSYLKENNKQFALTAFDQARKGGYTPRIAEAATLQYAKVNYDLGNFREVINALADFNKNFPKSTLAPEADDILSEAYLNSSNYMEAIRHIESLNNRSARINQTYQRVTYYQGVNYFNDGRFPEAVALLDKSLQHPYDNEIRAASHFVKGEAYSIGQRYDDAINSYAAVFRTSNAPKTEYYIKSRYGIGYAYYNTKQYDKARIHFESYINSDAIMPGHPNYADAMIRLADSYYVLKDYNKALEWYDKAIAQNSVDKDYAQFQKGVLLSLMGRKEQALQALQAVATNANSRYADNAIYQRAIIDFESTNYAPAIASFSSLIDNKPNSRLIPNALHKRGMAYVNLRKYNEAVADFKRVLDEFPSHKAANGALFSLQEALGALNQADQFDAYLAKFKAANPQSNALESVEYEAAKSLYFSEKYKQAVSKFEDYLKNYPNSPFVYDARYFLGDSYMKQGEKAKALQMLKQVVTENRSEYVNRAVQRIADIEFENGNYSEAIKYYTRLRDISDNRREQQN
ncbi:MAG: tetratricopeptide repeat protein, partial [Hymenobacteraceae bacterium]|nr:tetratricopeptide repeat protein [Hymenobacteraceae bacterium]MDX5396054.1 tetratricopeptide repeat protein [Hymenobacteraceae bacterium]MDX5512115.1 tetratricopeptide repeat protein [Hymenobacteraceae bacterium]